MLTATDYIQIEQLVASYGHALDSVGRVAPVAAPAGAERSEAAARRSGSARDVTIARRAKRRFNLGSRIDPRSEKPTKVGYRILDDGRKVRVAKATGEVIES